MSAAVYHFGPFTLDRGSYRLLKGAVPLTLPPKVLDLLFLLVSRPSSLVTKEDILQALWPDVAVTDNAITQVVSDLRQALGDNTASPQFVQTVPRRGYRFVAAVEVVEAPAPAPTPMRAATATAGERRGPRAIAVMDFTNVTSDPQVAWLASGIAETVTNDLRAIEDLTVLDRAFVAGGATKPHWRIVDHSPTGGIDFHGPPGRVTKVEVKSLVQSTDADMDDTFRRIEMRLGLEHVQRRLQRFRTRSAACFLIEAAGKPAAKALGADWPSFAMAVDVKVGEADAVRRVAQFDSLR